jgi:hypothetical protein
MAIMGCNPSRFQQDGMNRDLGLAQPVAVANDSMKLAFVVTISSSFMGWASHQKTSSFDPEHFKFSCSSWKR